jgi:hypothetical protein
MLAVPLISGTALRTPLDVPRSALLAGCFVIGYFGFYAASQWLKSPPRRRGRFLPAVLTYGAASAALGLVALLLTGAALLGWVPVFAVLLAPALWLASRRRERALLGGGLTTAAACLMVLVLTHDSPAAVFAGWPDARPAILVSLCLFGYFFGTVLHVKSLIRERGNTRVEFASASWHLAWTALSLTLWGWPDASLWVVLFALATARTIVLPRLARTRPLRPATIGVLEVALSTLALFCALSTPLAR